MGVFGPRLALAWIIASLGVACGGGTAEITTETRELPPADPRAVEEYMAGNRLLARPGAENERRAIERFQKALQIDRNLWEARYNLGTVYRRRGELRAAVTELEAAHTIQPGAPEPLLALAEAKYALGERDAAADLLEAYVASNPNEVSARVAYALVLREEREFDDALEQAREALVREPTNVAALLEVGRVYRAREQWDVAALVYRKALDLARATGEPPPPTPGATPAAAPATPPAAPREIDARVVATIHNELGLLELARGDTQAAFVEFGRASEEDPRYAPAHVNQGSVLLNAGDFRGAITEYRAALAADDADLEARVALGIALRGAGEHAEARRAWETVLDTHPNHAAALFNLAVLRAEFLNMRPASLELFRRFLDVAPSDVPEREVAERYLREIGSEGAGGGSG